MAHLNIGVDDRRYHGMVGVGGVGSGRFFALNGNHTLGREESRGGRFLKRNDYCKLHIVCHYVRTLLGPEFDTIPFGKVGDDEAGEKLLKEMRDAGLNMRYVTRSPGDQTLFSLCLVYPDGSGGNLTTDDSASSKVDAEFVARARREFARFGGRAIALALPEVPLEARQKLIELATEYGLFRVASFSSEEMMEVKDSGILSSIDLLGVNIDEAAAVFSHDVSRSSPEAIVEAAVESVTLANPSMIVSVTAGDNGSWSWNGRSLGHVPAFRTEVVGTAGAGDAHLSGLIVGLTAGLRMAEAQELGALVAAHSITSPHTLDRELDRCSLRGFVERTRPPICDAVRALLV